MVRLDLDEGARLLAALDLARSDVSAETPRTFDVSAETPRTFDVSAETPRTRADALMVLVESFLAEGARSRAGGTPTEVRLHVTEDELESGGGFKENAGCVGVSAETSRRLACDAAVVEVVEDAALRALRTSRKTCSVPTGMRRARSRAIRIGDPSARTTSSNGRTAAPPSSTTSSCSAGGTTPSCMSMGMGSSRSRAVARLFVAEAAKLGWRACRSCVERRRDVLVDLRRGALDHCVPHGDT